MKGSKGPLVFLKLPFKACRSGAVRIPKNPKPATLNPYNLILSTLAGVLETAAHVANASFADWVHLDVLSSESMRNRATEQKQTSDNSPRKS